MVELGKKCETGLHATESPERLFGRLVATELITITLCEAVLNNEALSRVRSQLMELWEKPRETIETQLSNHRDAKIAAVVSKKKQASIDAFKDTTSEFLDYLSDIQ